MSKFIKSDLIKRAIDNYNNKTFNDSKFDENNPIFSITETVYKQIVEKDDYATKEAIRNYLLNKYPKENIRIDFLDKDVVDEIINLGISEYIRRHEVWQNPNQF